jgi:hypothetical protein
MFRKLAISGVSILAVMTLVVSAQQPDIAQGQPSIAPQPLDALPAQPGQASPYWNGTIAFGNQPHREEMELHHKSQELIRQLAKAEGSKKGKIKDQLSETLGKQFDARQKRHQAEIKALEEKLKKLKDLVQKREDKRDEIVSKRLEQLVRDAEGLGW